MQALLVHFYNPVKDKDGLINKLVAYVDPPYCHCELEFANGESCAVYMGGRVHLKTRTFDTSSYDTVAVPCTHEQQARAYALAKALATEHQALETMAQTRALLHGQIPPGAVNAEHARRWRAAIQS